MPPTVDTKTRILDAAEQLFSREGFDATSMRAITTAADVNLASANYHFGSKEALAREVVGRLVAPINEERIRRLDRLEETPGAPTVEQIVRAFVEPALQFSGSNPDPVRMRIFGQVMTGPEPIRRAVVANFEIVARRFVSAFSMVLPQLSREDLVHRWRLFLASFTTVMMPLPLVEEHEQIVESEPDDAAFVEHFVAYTVAGWKAPLPAAGERESKPQ